MTQNSQPLDNPKAERVNGIIKGEFLDNYALQGLVDAREGVRKAVSLYNSSRPHASLELSTPNQIHFMNDNHKQETRSLVNL